MLESRNKAEGRRAGGEDGLQTVGVCGGGQERQRQDKRKAFEKERQAGRCVAYGIMITSSGSTGMACARARKCRKRGSAALCGGGGGCAAAPCRHTIWRPPPAMLPRHAAAAAAPPLRAPAARQAAATIVGAAFWLAATP